MSFEFKDESLNARNPFAHNRPPYQVRQTNGSFSGPLIRNRLTVSANVSHSLQEEADTVHATTPQGLFDLGIARPTVYREIGSRGTYQITDIHSVTVSTNLWNWSAKNFGVGGFSLPERAFAVLETGRNFNIRQFSAFSQRTLYETRFSVNRYTNSQKSSTQAVSINVLDSFNGGGAQSESDNTGLNYDFGNLFTRMGSKLTVKAGFGGAYRTQHSVSQNNFLGSFTFSSMADYLAGAPLTYRVNRGNPLLDTSQLEAAFFVQNDLKLTQRLTFMFGTRYEWQTNLNDTNNFAPRTGFAYALGKSTVLRGGAGMFLQRMGFGLVQNQLRSDGTRQYELVVNNPCYPEAFKCGTVTVIPPSSIRVTDSDIAAPYNVLTSISAEHTFPHNLFVSASYEFNRGIHAFRTRNLNAPLPGQPARPDPDRGNILNLESTGLSRSQILRLSFRQRFSIFNANASYTYNSSYTDNDGAFSNPSNNYDLRADWGRTNQNRHQINSTLNARLPMGVFLTGSVSANDGNPYTITTGKDDNGDSITNDRPPGVRKNTGDGPRFMNVNFNISKAIFFTPNGAQNGSATNMNVFANMSNAFNRTNYGTPSGVMSSTNFGKSFNARNAREIQVGIRFQF